jgi:hypothetical protein
MFDLDDWASEMAFMWVLAEELDKESERKLEYQSVQLQLSLEVQHEDN